MSSFVEINVLMVCLGNICRSPTAHGVLLKKVKNKKLENIIKVDSAGTGDWHIGSNPDPRSIAAAARRGYNIGHFKARQVHNSDFARFDYILAMDRNNQSDLDKRASRVSKKKIELLLDYGSTEHKVVPDPYYSGEQGFELVLDLIEEASVNFLETIITHHKLT